MSCPIQMQLSLKENFFSDSFVPFQESTSNFKYFEKKDDRLYIIVIANLFQKSQTVKDMIGQLSKKHFQTTLSMSTF